MIPVLFYAMIPVDRHVSKKNSRPVYSRGGRPFIGKSDLLRTAEEHLVGALKDRLPDLKGEMIKGSIHCTFVFGIEKGQYYTKKGIRSMKLPDLSNLIQLPEDALQKAGIIENDTNILSLDGSRRIPSNSNYIEITIRPFLGGSLLDTAT